MKKLFIVAMVLIVILGTEGISPADQLKVQGIDTIVEFGKSVDWHHGRDRIASARLGQDGYYDVFTMKPDASDLRVLTQALKGCPQKHNGNPCFHPSGRFLVFTGQDERLPDQNQAVRRLAVPGSGLGSNLFIMDVDGQVCHQLTKYKLTQPLRAVIHPQFSKDGRKLAWAERIRKGESFGGGWVIKIADFVEGDSPRLDGVKSLEPGRQDCFYEVHDFSGDGKTLLFSGNLQAGQIFTGLDIYELNLDSGAINRLTHSDRDWDEHAHYSPDGRKMAWMSSSGFDIHYGPKKGRDATWGHYLKTELWLMDADGSNPKQLTHFNTPGYPENIKGARCIVSDSTWSPDGRSILTCVAWFRGGQNGVKLMRIYLH